MDQDLLTLQQVDAGAYAPVMTAIQAAAVAVAYAHIFDTPFPEAAVQARWSAHSGPVVVAERDGAAVGFAAAQHATLEALYVIPAEACRRTGGALLGAVSPVTRLWVLEANTAARGFYARRGWRWTGERRDSLDADGVPALLYVT